jgi:hypothetical protein
MLPRYGARPVPGTAGWGLPDGDHMSRVLLAALITALAAGCTSQPKRMVFLDDAASGPAFVRSELPPDRYPSFMAAEGNIYSCRYGIRLLKSADFEPPKTQLFERVLAESMPAVAENDVVLKRFDVYYNWRLRLLGFVGSSAMGAIVTVPARSASRQNKDVWTDETFHVELVGDSSGSQRGNQVGCDDAGEGEYFAGEVRGGHDVIVTWLRFAIDEQDYHLRSFHQFVYAGEDSVLQNAIAAVLRTIRSVPALVEP